MEIIIKIEVKEMADLVKEIQHQPNAERITNTIRHRLREALAEES